MILLAEEECETILEVTTDWFWNSSVFFSFGFIECFKHELNTSFHDGESLYEICANFIHYPLLHL